VPAAPSPREPRPLRWLRDLFWRRSGAEGLRQFKQAFAPRWNRLYIAAPSRLALAFGALDILREITRSGPTPRS
jgi:phosphatidylglycerol lysyltransferase